MNQILEELYKMKDLQIVRFFSLFFGEDQLSPVFTQFKNKISSGGLVKELVLWAVFLAVGTFLIDQVFYWTNPGQVELAKNNWKNFTAGVANLGASARVLFERIRGAGGKRRGKSDGRW